MGFFDELGLGDLLSSVREMSDEISTLKDDVISSVAGPTDDLKSTFHDITGSISDSINGTDAPTDDASN